MSNGDHLVGEVKSKLRYVLKLLLVVINHTDNKSDLSRRSERIVQLANQLNCMIS